MKYRFRNIVEERRLIAIVVLVLFIIVCTILFSQISYSRYASNFEVNVDSVTGEMICNVEVDVNPSYVENNMAYFRVIVSNSRDGVVTATDVEYALKISNDSNSNGIFYYIDSEGIKSDDNGAFASSISSQTYSFGKDAEERIFKVYVKVPSNLKEVVNFKVDLEAVQKKME